MIKAKSLFFSYRRGDQKVQVLDNVSFEIPLGKLTAIRGPSGSGKSTLLYLLGGFLKPDSGNIQIGNKDLFEMKDLDLAWFRSRNIGFVFQQFHLLPRATVLENILIAGHYPVEFESDKEALKIRAIELSRSLGIEDQLEKTPNQLSGGQQQRVAIARALLNDPNIVLADEPTGSLDSKTSAEIFSLLKSLTREGRTVVLITHDNQLSNQCDEIIEMMDGRVVKATMSPSGDVGESSPLHIRKERATASLAILMSLLPVVMKNLKVNRMRSILTMMGVSIGIAALTAMVTFGSFVQEKVISGYEKMGVNTISLQGSSNWRAKAKDTGLVYFTEFDPEKDLIPLRKTFPQIEAISPTMVNWNKPDVTAGGNLVSGDATPVGVNENYFRITDRKFLGGGPISLFHVANRSSVCVIGWQIAERLFGRRNPLNNIISSTASDETAFSCRVIGVLASVQSNNEWDKPDFHILLPYTYFQTVNNFWYSRMNNLTIKLRPGSDIESTSKAIKRFFNNKYGNAALFNVGSDAIMVAQLKQFVGVFRMLLAAIALISLLVGGMGITNMMLASIGEQLREIGIRKAMGATDQSLYSQYLLESVVLCLISGFIGLFVGIAGYQSVIFLASKVINQIKFEWTINWPAVVFSFVAMLLVGVISGWVPALRARNLQVAEALRSD